MKIAQPVRIGLWLLLGLNLLMAFGAVGVFTRMSPAISVIIDRNGKSLEACETMLTCLALITDDAEDNGAREKIFLDALTRARNNITETEEPDVLTLIAVNYKDAFAGQGDARRRTVTAVGRLGKINRDAMVRADLRARQFGHAGAWGIVFMASAVFFAGMVFRRSLSNHVIAPLEEIYAVISAHRRGDTMRRCTGSDLPRDIRIVFGALDEFLDFHQSRLALCNHALHALPQHDEEKS
ncbi:hypothetical protein JCM14469_14860 [Desulfatiferula olefinivorans]